MPLTELESSITLVHLKIGPFWAEWAVQDLLYKRSIKLGLTPKKKKKLGFSAKYGRFFSIFGKYVH